MKKNVHVDRLKAGLSGQFCRSTVPPLSFMSICWLVLGCSSYMPGVLFKHLRGLARPCLFLCWLTTCYEENNQHFCHLDSASVDKQASRVAWKNTLARARFSICRMLPLTSSQWFLEA